MARTSLSLIFIFIFIFIIFIFAGMYQAGLASILPSGWRGCTARAKMLLCYRGDEMTKRMAVLVLAVGMTIPGFMQTGFTQALAQTGAPQKRPKLLAAAPGACTKAYPHKNWAGAAPPRS